MAKAKKESKPQFPSFFGSHASMIDEEETAKLNDPSKVALRDENKKDFYITERSRLDTGLADPNRYVTSRLKHLYEGKGEGKDKKKKD